MDVSLKVLCGILDTFAESGKLFSNERQFQLELAWELKEHGYTVLLEVLEKSKRKKYVDIVVELSPNEYVAIELKYTIRQKDMVYDVNGKCVRTFAQGNDDGRRYDFLYDFQRIEELINQKTDAFSIANAKVVKGFAIIMTNDNYWATNGDSTNYRDVSLCEGREISGGVEMNLYSKGEVVRVPITLKRSYSCHWHDYILSNTHISYLTEKGNSKEVEYSNYPFRYMIFEIKDN